MMEFTEIQIVASDVNHDGNVDTEDTNFVGSYVARHQGYETITQNVEAKISNVIYTEE